MNQRQQKIAEAIFAWFDGPEVVEGMDPQPPYTFNVDRERLYLGVDGYLDCKKLAEAIDAALEAGAGIEPT